jgi:hypothetical protein
MWSTLPQAPESTESLWVGLKLFVSGSGPARRIPALVARSPSVIVSWTRGSMRQFDPLLGNKRTGYIRQGEFACCFLVISEHFSIADTM